MEPNDKKIYNFFNVNFIKHYSVSTIFVFPKLRYVNKNDYLAIAFSVVMFGLFVWIALRCNVSIFQQPHQPSMNDEMEPTRRGSGHKISHRSEAKASKSRRPDNSGFQSDLSSVSREASSHNSRTKTRDSLPPISKPVSQNGSSSVFPVPNPRRNPPTVGPAENGIRNRSDSPTRPSNTEASTQPRKSLSTRKKIV